jgi:hypothetical protein
MLATTVKRFGAVSSVVERLVYTDSRPIFSLYPELIRRAQRWVN